MRVLLRPSHAALLSVFLATSAYSPHALAFADDDARRAILELREQVQRITAQNQQARLQLAEQIELLRQEVATLRGQVEQMNWKLRGAGGDSAPAPTSSSAAVDPQEKVAFDTPMEAFRAGNYKAAANGFGDFLAAYPESQLAADAQFYQGSSRYATKDFKGSIQVMQNFLQANAKHSRAPDALLVIAASQTELNDLAGTKASLQRIVRDYPQSKAAETAKSRLQLLQ